MIYDSVKLYFVIFCFSLLSPVVRARNFMKQVNTDAFGNDIVEDAANEPSIAVDPNNPNRMAIGWRQFDSIGSNFRQAGIGYSTDGGLTWIAGVLTPGQFRSDPVLESDADGNFFFSSLTSTTSASTFKSIDGGATWGEPVNSFGGDKQWMAIDRTNGQGRGNVYQHWNEQFSSVPNTSFTRSTNGGASYAAPTSGPVPYTKWGTVDVGSNGTVYIAGSTLNETGQLFSKSSNAKDSSQPPVFSASKSISLGGTHAFGQSINPDGLSGQIWIAADHSQTANGGNIYVLGSVNPPGADPLDVMFIRSTDDGATWSAPTRINNDADGDAFQWFGTMSVAPNGRIDVVWNDTRGPTNISSTLYYSYSLDGGLSWNGNTPLTVPFDQALGYPSQDKIGDYYDMTSTNDAAHLAFAATFTGGQDVYYMRIDAVPEPSSALLVLCAAGCVAGQRGQRRTAL